MHHDVYRIRLLVLAVAAVIGFGTLAWHLFELQILRHEELLDKAREKYTASRRVVGSRGQIFDLHGSLLAGNLACRDLFAEPHRFRQELPAVLALLSHELDLPPSVLAEKCAQSFRLRRPQVEVVLARGIEIKQAEQLAQKIRVKDYKGLRFVDSTRRYYPKQSLLANLIGFVDGEARGSAGIEKRYDQELQPTSERTIYERDRQGYTIHQQDSEPTTKPRDGGNIFLTIDEAIQQIVEEELLAMVRAHQPTAAYAVMADPRTGAIMAMAQYPTFDPNNRKQMDPRAWQNRLLIEGFEPGSIMKACTVTGALDAKLVTLNTAFNCESGMWFYGGRSLRDSGHKYGVLQVRNIIQKSSNIGTAKIAVLMGKERLDQTLRTFGFGKPTGIGLANEASGIYRKLKHWDGLSITRFAIGQGILVTPLQMVQAYCALANHGRMPQLHVVARVEDPANGRVETNRPPPKGMVAGEAAIRDITTALKLVTQEGGTAPRAAVAGYEVAGKTGTAQKVVNGQYVSKYVADFIGYIPAEDPAFVLLVAADEPIKGGYYGGVVAAPVFSRIAEKTLRYLQVAPAVPTAVPAPSPSASPTSPASTTPAEDPLSDFLGSPPAPAPDSR